jgi:predicted nucleic acid-binding protein
MRKALLADAGPLYAAVDPSDKHHSQALRELQELARCRCEVVVSFSTLAEAYSLIRRKLGQSIALRWLNEMVDAALINPTPEDYRLAIVKLAAFADQSITLFDATVAVLASRLGLEVWTYDHHFDVMRVLVWR